MPILRLGPSTLAKLTSGGGAAFGVPDAWSMTSYGSGWPIAPVSAPQDVELPRSIDYPISINATLTPRTGYGLMPFSALLEAYENVTEVKMPVSLIHRELASFKPHLVDDDENEVEDHPYQWLCDAPDRKTPFGVWLTRFLKSAKVYDAPAVYLQHDTDDTTTALHYIDGSTLFVIVDQFGNVPAPERVDEYVRRVSTEPQTTSAPSTTTTAFPDLASFIAAYRKRQETGQAVPAKMPAYTQIIKGTPFSWWSADQIWYMPQSRRMNAPYGESFIEQAWAWIMVIVNITAFELGHYRTGNMPEGFVTLPKDWFKTPDQLMAGEMMYNARMTSNPATERMRLRMFPEGSSWTETKKPDFPADLYKQAWNNVLHTIGIPPSEFGDIPGAGLGGAGFKEGAATDLGRNTLNPHRNFVASLFNAVLAHDGVDDAHFELAYPMDEIDPDKQKQSVFDGMAHGTLSLNDALGQLKLNPVGDPKDPNNIANKHLIVAGTTIYVVEEMTTQNGMAVPSFAPNQAGGEPLGPEAVMEQDGKTHSPEDLKTLQSIIRHIQETGTLDGKFISVPSVRKEAPPQRIAVPDAYMQETPGDPDYAPINPVLLQSGIEQRRHNETPILPVTPADNARPVGVSHMSEWFTRAMDQEQAAHPSMPRHEVEALVRANLRERYDYYGYQELAEVEGREHPLLHPGIAFAPPPDLGKLAKHCGVCPEDDDYFGAPISREVPLNFPGDNHANDVELIAMCPDGLPPKAALWKPEGGEVSALQDWIGGPQYVREEAAYLLDRSLGFMLVPVAYVAEADDEVGAAVYYTHDAAPGGPMAQYAPEWLERAAVLDYIMNQVDRHEPNHNYLTHPDDNTRPVLIDNGLSFPVNPQFGCNSPFCVAWLNKPLSDETLAAIQLCLGDASTWQDIQTLVGSEATQKARACARYLLEQKMLIPAQEATTA